MSNLCFNPWLKYMTFTYNAHRFKQCFKPLGYTCPFFLFVFFRPSLFFLLLASSDRPKFLAFKKQTKKIYVVNPFFILNSSFNHKNERGNNIEFR